MYLLNDNGYYFRLIQIETEISKLTLEKLNSVQRHAAGGGHTCLLPLLPELLWTVVESS